MLTVGVFFGFLVLLTIHIALFVRLSDKTLQRDNVLSQNILEIQKQLLETETAIEQASG